MKNKNLISIILTVFIIGLILLSGPARAVTVDISQPNNADKGSDVSFSITVDINDPDTYLPIQYTNIILTGPDSFSKTCKVYMDGTDDCDDVDISITNDLGYDYGYGYGYDSGIGYGYNFGYGYGYGYSGAYGLITFDVIWHTPSDLTDGTYNVQANVHAGSTSHEFSSSQKSFSITTFTTTGGDTGGGAGGGGGGTYTIPIEEPEIEEITPSPTPTETTETGSEEEGAGMEGIAGAAVTGNIITRNPIAAAIVVAIVVIFGLIAYFEILKKKKY